MNEIENALMKTGLSEQEATDALAEMRYRYANGMDADGILILYGLDPSLERYLVEFLKAA